MNSKSSGPQSLCDLETFAQSGADNGTCDLGYADGQAASKLSGLIGFPF